MSIVHYLLKTFFLQEIKITFIIIVISLLINIFQINILSYISASIINYIKDKNIKNVYIYYKYFILVSLLYIFLYYIYKYLQNKLLSNLRPWIKNKLIQMLLTINNDNYSDENFSKINSPLNRISSIIFLVFNNLITFLLPNLTLLVIVFFYFLYINKYFALYFLIGNIFIFLSIYLSWNKIMKFNIKYEEDFVKNDNDTVEILNNVDKIIYRTQINNVLDNYSNIIDNLKNSSFNFYSSANNTSVYTNVIVLIMLSILILYLINLYSIKKITITIFITFFTILLLYRDRLMVVLQQLPDYIEFFGRCNAILDNFNNYEEKYNNIKTTIYKKHDLDFNSITIKNLNFKYNDDKIIFNNYNLKIDLNNKIIGIVGKSGNGKSTLAKLIIKLYKFSGDIYIDNINTNNIDGDYIKQNIIYVNQNSKLFDINIRDNLLYGCNDKNICNKYMNEIYKFSKIKELLNKINFNNNAGQGGEKLSGGQRQIINIINGLVLDSKIIILDEPTNALDIELKKDVIDMIKYFKKYKKCIIIISHDQDIINIFDNVINI